MTREEVKRILATLVYAYPKLTFPKSVEGITAVDVWYDNLGDIDFEDAKKATTIAIQRSEFPPSIAEIRKAYKEIEDKRKEIKSAIRQEYEATRSYYPSCGEYNNGWKEFQERSNGDRDRAKKLHIALIDYVREMEKTGGNTEPFTERIKSIEI